ncbi:oxidation resistance protein 1 isoform X3 [Ischnura elegans]|uniref:oxidation resistance protein 1 isoform X3 n=1 Tax=Ischnura elegans TaxID=197161 RepID=UPI001ED866A9|nr:oxidation resistance protein 1 isoform X3 [Ischnura elegans]
MLQTTWSTPSIPGLLRRESSSSASSPRGSLRGSIDSPGLLVATSPEPYLREPEEKPRRRKSWHPKIERKRKKGVVSTTSPPPQVPGMPHHKHKRVSWWSIFVPDHWPRGRRASQDVTRTSDNIVPWLRSKSRSVDHGMGTPFDMDSLRSKVDGRLESVGEGTYQKKSQTNAPAQEPADGVKEVCLTERKMGKNAQPMNTTTYTVEASDTLTSVAARFDTTPSELCKLNRLASRLIFPGQLLYVPAKGGGEDGGEEGGDGGGGEEGGAGGRRRSSGSSVTTPTGDRRPGDEAEEEKELLDILRPSSPKPCLERMRSSPSPPHGVGDGTEERHVDRECLERFLKINVRHITDGQGVVGGVLLVTPNAVMFDPNVSDPLVIEHGPESYGVIAPMEYVVNAAIYFDIAHMRVRHMSKDTPRTDLPKPEIYHGRGSSHIDEECPSSQHSPGKDSLLVKDETFPELAPRSSPEGEDEEDEELSPEGSVCSFREVGGGAADDTTIPFREGNAFPKAFERDLVTPPTILDGSSHPVEGATSRGVSGGTPDLLRREAKGPGASPDVLPAIGNAKGESVDEVDAVTGQCGVVVTSGEPKSLSLDSSGDGQEQRVSVDMEAVSAEHGVDGNLEKLSCHDSGIDIRESSGGVTAVGMNVSVSSGRTPTPPAVSSRKKASSVSFSLDSGEGPHPDDVDAKSEGAEKTKVVQKAATVEDVEKQESRKTKVFKRLSYPLSWMEGFGSDKDVSKDPGSGGNPPNSAPPQALHNQQQQHSSVFSKVFSSSPMNLVELGSGLLFGGSEDSGTSLGVPSPGPTPPVAPMGPSSSLPRTPRPPLPPGVVLPEPRSEGEGGSSTPPPSIGRSSMDVVRGRGDGFGRKASGLTIGSGVKHQHPSVRLDYRSMVSVEDMPELFVSFDKLIPRPARSCEDPPLYLRLRMGKPKDRKIPRSTPIMSYGKKKMRPEYWFSVPRNRVDDLYSFLMLWVPHLYGDLDEMDPAERGYELVESDSELWEEEEDCAEDEVNGRKGGKGKSRRGRESDGDIGELTRESWEVLSMSEELRRALYAASSAASLESSASSEVFLPELAGTTEILSEEHRRKLCRHLPARAEGYAWSLAFSTSQHGFSLNSMYRKMARVESPILLVVQDTENNVFGALTSCALKVSDHFYGTGESFLFKFDIDSQDTTCTVYNWTGENIYFIKGNNESLAIGAGDGKFGLWLDGDLYQGRTQHCDTYGNEPLVPSGDFVIKTLECWAFV